MLSVLFSYKTTFRQRTHIWTFVSVFWFYTLFFAWRSNLDPSNQLYYGVVQRFYLQNSIIIIYLASLTLNEILTFSKMPESTNIATALAFILIAIRYKKNNYSNFDFVQNFGDLHIDAFPPNSVILMKGDLPANTFRYLELIEQKRDDLQFVDTQPMTYIWYLKYQRKRFNLSFPGDKYSLDRKPGSFSLQDLIRSGVFYLYTFLVFFFFIC